MLRFDSLKLQFSKELVSFDPANYNKTTKEIEDCEQISYNLKYKNKLIIGLKNITITDNYCNIEISSKLIPNIYYDMINVATIDKYLNEINKPNLIRFDLDSLIRNSNVLTCDVTNNLKVTGKPEHYIYSLVPFKMNDKYEYKLYPNKSIIFKRNVKTSSLKESITIYIKYTELLEKRNNEFRNKINIEDFKNVVRFESRFENFELMRNSFKTKDNSLYEIINSKENPNLKIFERITDIESTQVETFNNYKTLLQMKTKYKHSKLRNIQGNLAILNSCNNDIDLVKLYFKTNSNANNSRYIREMKSLIKFKSEIENKSLEDKISEMKKLLAA